MGVGWTSQQRLAVSIHWRKTIEERILVSHLQAISYLHLTKGRCTFSGRSPFFQSNTSIKSFQVFLADFVSEKFSARSALPPSLERGGGGGGALLLIQTVAADRGKGRNSRVQITLATIEEARLSSRKANVWLRLVLTSKQAQSCSSPFIVALRVPLLEQHAKGLTAARCQDHQHGNFLTILRSSALITMKTGCTGRSGCLSYHGECQEEATSWYCSWMEEAFILCSA
ncbi:hypothetical protein BKA81DRAFT_218175 [Phyllosticta paracitricarpa]